MNTQTKQKTPSVKAITISGREVKKVFDYLYKLQERANADILEKKKFSSAVDEAIKLEAVLFYMLDIREHFKKYAEERKKIEAENQ